ncbi:Tol-Pal system beta propeller repeat protein TolB [Guyparkeria sp.]|uniref:Tol-Pal system beta propeller repeat protein TolB n=1 Tax=Guyparkeria sp. TaxID=2035736 RepID=UPI0035627966
MKILADKQLRIGAHLSWRRNRRVPAAPRGWLASLLAATAMLALLSTPARAALEIDISGGTESGVPIAVVPFDQPGGIDDLARIIGDDLARSGLFAPISRDVMPGRPTGPEQIRIDDWRAGKASYVVMGSVESDGDRLRTSFYLVDVSDGSRLIGSRITGSASNDRSIAHRISDLVYEELTGDRGAFSTRLAYVTERGRGDDKTFTLQIADSDGANPRTVLESPYPIMSPSWSPDGGQLAYVSFEGNRSAIWVQDLGTGERYQLTDFPGINGAPAWSPRGDKIAVTLSKGGNPDIYVIDLGSRRSTQWTRNGAIDTEPTWYPDNRSIAFTSDRFGQPQVFRKSSPDDRARRLTFDTPYAAGPRISPDGESLAFVTREGSGFHVAQQELADGERRLLSRGGSEERPSYAPNGAMVVYAAQSGSGSVLKISPVIGGEPQTLSYDRGKVRDPVWGPFID